MASFGGIQGFGFNAQFSFQSSFATNSFASNNVPYAGSNYGAYQTQQSAGYALGALGQLQGSYLDILGGGNYPGQPAPFASFNNVFVPQGASPFASFNNAFGRQAQPFASFNNVFVPPSASPFASFNNVFVPQGAQSFASFNNVFARSATPFASFGGPFPGQPQFAQGTGAITLFPATQFIPFR